MTEGQKAILAELNKLPLDRMKEAEWPMEQTNSNIFEQEWFDRRDAWLEGGKQ